MNDRHIDLVQHSFAQVQPLAGAVSALFYARLFELDPSLRPLFRGDLEAQGHKLMLMLNVAVANLRRPEVVLPALRALGERHVDYGVTDAHYDTVGAALLWTLQEGLGDAFTPELRAAWEAVYVRVAETMKAAAHQKLAARSTGVGHDARSGLK